MFLTKRNTQIVIGLAVMGLALATTALTYRSQSVGLAIVRVSQLTATGALLFGILRAHPQHTARFLLFWLSITTVFITALLYVGLDYFIEYGIWYSEWYLSVFLPWAAAGGIAYMMNIIYKDYVELTIQTVAEVKQPPSYDSSFQSLIVSLET